MERQETRVNEKKKLVIRMKKLTSIKSTKRNEVNEVKPETKRYEQMHARACVCVCVYVCVCVCVCARERERERERVRERKCHWENERNSQEGGEKEIVRKKRDCKKEK